jgi:phosphoribosyl-AMP cyclohydrolase
MSQAETNVQLDFSKLNGLVPVVLQHAETRDVVMVGFVDQRAWEETLRTGTVVLFRRTLGRVQVKGEKEGKVVRITRMVVDCDDDTVLLEVLPEATICHENGDTCFFKEVAVPRPSDQGV